MGVEMNEELNIEGFPPNLLQTLKSLSGGEESLQPAENDPQLTSNNNQLHQGLFSWIDNDDMMLSQAHSGSSSSNKRNLQAEESEQHPLLKKSKKVSFVLPNRN